MNTGLDLGIGKIGPEGREELPHGLFRLQLGVQDEDLDCSKQSRNRKGQSRSGGSQPSAQACGAVGTTTSPVQPDSNHPRQDTSEERDDSHQHAEKPGLDNRRASNSAVIGG